MKKLLHMPSSHFTARYDVDLKTNQVSGLAASFSSKDSSSKGASNSIESEKEYVSLLSDQDLLMAHDLQMHLQISHQPEQYFQKAFEDLKNLHSSEHEYFAKRNLLLHSLVCIELANRFPQLLDKASAKQALHLIAGLNWKISNQSLADAGCIKLHTILLAAASFYSQKTIKEHLYFFSDQLHRSTTSSALGIECGLAVSLLRIEFSDKLQKLTNKEIFSALPAKAPKEWNF